MGLRNLLWTFALAPLLLAGACGGNQDPAASPSSEESRLRVVTTTALLADFVKNIGGDWVEVISLVPPGADVHSFQTTPEHSIAISRAQVIVFNGSGLDDFLEPVVNGAIDPDAVRVVAAEGLMEKAASLTVDMGSAGDAGSAGSQAENGGDPHFWQNPEFAISYVESIREGLASADPAHGADYQAGAERYAGLLRDLDLEVAQILGEVPLELRHLVTFHDAFTHFGQHYGWRVSAFVANDAVDVSPAAVVEIMDRVKNGRIPAVFVEPQFQSEVMRRAAEDAGVAIGEIMSDLSDAGVSSDGGTSYLVPSYIEMMRANARTLAELLN